MFLVVLSALAIVSIVSLRQIYYLHDQQEISEVNAAIRTELSELRIAISEAEKAQLAFFLAGDEPSTMASEAAEVSRLIDELQPDLEFLEVPETTVEELAQLGRTWRARHLRMEEAVLLFRQGEREQAIQLAAGIDDQGSLQVGNLFSSINAELLKLRAMQREDTEQTLAFGLAAPLLAIAIILAVGIHYYRRFASQQEESEQSIRALENSKWTLEQSILERNAELVKLTKELKAASAQKDRFLAMLGHELRNPLAPMVNSIEYLLYHDVDRTTLRDTARTMYEQCRRMTRLVNDLMDIGQIASGEMKFDMQIVDLRAIVESIAQASQKIASDQGVTLTLALSEDPVWVNGDGERLEQVIENLVNNSLKFTAQGDEITVGLEANEDEALLRVSDTGRGMPPEVARDIFEPFFRGDPDDARGLGLGLSIVAEIVHAHQGEVHARSEGPGQGTEITVSLTRLPIDQPPEPPAPRSSPEVETMHFLIVDDYQANVESLAGVLRMKDHAVTTAATGEEAIAQFKQTKPDVVLLDLGLPDLDGVEVGRILLGLDPSACIIAVTGMGHDSIRAKTEDAGFAAHMTKPVRVPDLLRTVQAVREPLE